MRTRFLAIPGALLALPALYLLVWPVPVEPEAWSPQPHAAEAWPGTGTLAGATRVELPDGHGPEDVDVDDQGRVVVGLHDGRILRYPAGGGAPQVLADTGGRPLGLHWDLDGSLLVADAWKGLLRINEDGAIETLAASCGGRELIFTDDLEVAADGTIWFSDATVRFRQPQWKLDILENAASGRLCRWRPGMAEAEEVLAGLYFANGVAIDPDQQFVLVNETSRYRVRRLWIAGPRAGQDELLIEDLPGFPDGISTGSAGRFWIAVASPRNPLVDKAGPSPWLRKVMVRLPPALQPKPARTARAVAVNADGAVVADLFDPEGTALTVVTSVQERDGRLYLGSLVDTAWAFIEAP